MEQKNSSHVSATSQGRRRFFGWVSKIASGAAVAGVGLGLTDPSHVLAATKGEGTILASTFRLLPSKSSNCVDCTNCAVDSCGFEPHCPSTHPFYMVWEQDFGCAPHCSANFFNACMTSCHVNPCNNG